MLGPFCCSEEKEGDHIPSASSRRTLVLVVQYYSRLSTVVWWVGLNAVELLMTSRGSLGWTDAEEGRRLMTWLHVVAWSLPALLAVALLTIDVINVFVTFFITATFLQFFSWNVFTSVNMVVSLIKNFKNHF